MQNNQLLKELIELGLSKQTSKSPAAAAVVDVLIGKEADADVARMKAIHARMEDIETFLDGSAKQLQLILASLQRMA